MEPMGDREEVADAAYQAPFAMPRPRRPRTASTASTASFFDDRELKEAQDWQSRHAGDAPPATAGAGRRRRRGGVFADRLLRRLEVFREDPVALRVEQEHWRELRHLPARVVYSVRFIIARSKPEFAD